MGTTNQTVLRSISPFTPERAARFDELQRKLAPLWRMIGRTDPGGEVYEANTLVVVPSLPAEYGVSGALQQILEERFLFLTFLLRQPQVRILYLTSNPIDSLTIDYYLHNLPDVTISNARKRLFLLSPRDGSGRSLAEKVLERPWFIRTIRAHIPDPDRAHIVPLTTTDLERELALQLGIPMYAADPRHYALGGKSGARRIFAEEGVQHPLGVEDITDEAGFIDAIAQMRKHKPAIRKVIAKHNQGVSGMGNAVVVLRDLPPPGDDGERDAIAKRLRAMQYESSSQDYAGYMADVAEQGGIVEEMIDGEEKQSPSVQMRISPLGEVEVLSTHDQMLGGPSGQTYVGAVFPADPAYSRLITREAAKVGQRFVREGIVGRFAIDFLTVRNGGGEWEPYAIEVNLRKGGTTHPFLTLQYLTDGIYDVGSGIFTTELGETRYYVASDNVKSDAYRVFAPDDLLDLISLHRLTFDQTCQNGVVLHMFSAVGELGRLGVTCIHATPQRARGLYDDFIALLDREAARRIGADG